MRGEIDEELSEPVRRIRALTETRAVLQRASKLYSRWSCSNSAECCQLATTKRVPWLWPSEWELILEFLRLSRRPLPRSRADGGCPFLDEQGTKCTVYEARPFGCRTFFCEQRVRGPNVQPTIETNDLLHALGSANQEWRDSAEPRPLPEWHAGTA